jgi:hypothetical protein
LVGATLSVSLQDVQPLPLPRKILVPQAIAHEGEDRLQIVGL